MLSSASLVLLNSMFCKASGLVLQAKRLDETITKLLLEKVDYLVVMLCIEVNHTI